MRFYLALTLTVAMGCGSHSNGNGNGNGDGGNGTGGVGGGGSASGDMSVGGKGGGGRSDMSAVSTCDVGAQTGCAVGEKCVPSFGGGGGGGGGGGVTGTCVPDGTAAVGAPCTPSSGNSSTIDDNCKAGSLCDNTGANSTYVCHKICAADSACGSGARCGSIINRVNYGLCYGTCTAFGGGCPAGNDCSVPFDDIAATQTSEIGFFVCKKTGSGALNAQCQADSDCAAGLACDQQAGCFAICDASHTCPAGSDGGVLSCNALVSQANGAGYCN